MFQGVVEIVPLVPDTHMTGKGIDACMPGIVPRADLFSFRRSNLKSKRGWYTPRLLHEEVTINACLSPAQPHEYSLPPKSAQRSAEQRDHNHHYGKEFLYNLLPLFYIRQINSQFLINLFPVHDHRQINTVDPRVHTPMTPPPLEINLPDIFPRS